MTSVWSPIHSTAVSVHNLAAPFGGDPVQYWKQNRNLITPNDRQEFIQISWIPLSSSL